MLVAWLLSDANLSGDEMAATAARIRRGEVIKPSERMLEKARLALGVHLATDPGLTPVERAVLVVVSILLTPLPAWTIWFWWRRERPRAAIQALAIALPATLFFVVLVLWLRLRGH
jgi:hypothetical protein